MAEDGIDVTHHDVILAERYQLIHKPYLNELADAFFPRGMARNDPRVSPLYSDLRGFPPVLIQVGSDKTLLDDATRFAAAAGTADVAATLEIWPHMIHAWPLLNARLELGRRALANAGVFTTTHLDDRAEGTVTARQHAN